MPTLDDSDVRYIFNHGFTGVLPNGSTQFLGANPRRISITFECGTGGPFRLLPGEAADNDHGWNLQSLGSLELLYKDWGDVITREWQAFSMGGAGGLWWGELSYERIL